TSSLHDDKAVVFHSLGNLYSPNAPNHPKIPHLSPTSYFLTCYLYPEVRADFKYILNHLNSYKMKKAILKIFGVAALAAAMIYDVQVFGRDGDAGISLAALGSMAVANNEGSTCCIGSNFTVSQIGRASCRE